MCLVMDKSRSAIVALLGMFVPLTAHANWSTVCDDGRCQLFVELMDASKKVQSRLYFHNVASEAAAAEPKGAGTAEKRIIGVAVTPLGIYIPAGVTMRVDQKSPFKAELIDCRSEQGCRAAFDLNPSLLKVFEHGKTVSVSVIDGQNRREVTFGYGLDGFAEAYKAFLKKL